jgi:hypothetical protein
MSEITPNTPNPVREDAYVEELAEKLGIDPQYIPKSPVWRNEEEIKAIAEMFANMSGGSSGGGVLVVHRDENDTLDKTWQEIHDAIADGIVVISRVSEKNALSDLILTANDNTPNTGYFEVESVGGDIYAASSANGYPSYTE